MRARRASQAAGQLGRGQALDRQRVDERRCPSPSARGSCRRARRTSAGAASRWSRRASPACRGPSRSWRRAAPRRRCRGRPTPSRPSSVASVWRGGGRVCFVSDLEAAVEALPLRERRQRRAPPSALVRAFPVAARAARPPASPRRGARVRARGSDRAAAAAPSRRSRRPAVRRRRRRRGSAAARGSPAGGADADHDLGERELGVGVERAEEPPRDQIEDAPLVARQLVEVDRACPSG